jgi:PAS domain S-box-containing protein
VNAVTHQAKFSGATPESGPAELPEATLAALLGDTLQALAASSSAALDLLNQSPGQAAIVDRELVVRWANPAFARLLDTTTGNIVGQPLAALFGDMDRHGARFARAFAGDALHFLLSTSPPGGAGCDLNLHLRPVRDAANEVQALCVFIGSPGSDEPGWQALPQTADAMRQVVRSLPDLVLVLDRELHVLFANRAFNRRSPDELQGLHITEFFPEHLHPTALASMHRVLARGEVDGFAAEIDGLDGQTRHFDVRASAIRRDAKIVGLTLNAAETTEQIRAERAIATQARMIESMLEGVAVINERGVIEITNPAFDTMFAYRRGELIGREMSLLAGWPFENRERWQSNLDDPRRSAHSASSVLLEFDGRRRDGSHFSAAGVLSGFEVAGRNHSLVVLQDVSERKQLERAILQAVNREQYRIGNDLHDGLGQELTGVALMLRGVAGRVTAEYPAILPEIENITRLVNNAIESTRALARGLSPVNLERGGLQDALESLAMHASELYGVPTVFTHRLQPPRLLNAELANHLYRIAQEAVRNAVRHGNARSIRLHLSSARAKVKLAIIDDGIGMPAGAIDATGMGLKIMRYRARILGGTVGFELAEPSGTKVVCECPLEMPGGSTTPRRKPRQRNRPVTRASSAPSPHD